MATPLIIDVEVVTTPPVEVVTLVIGTPGQTGPAGPSGSATEAGITAALGYKPVSPSQAIAFAIAL
jgi:hypothetical protein